MKDSWTGWINIIHMKDQQWKQQQQYEPIFTQEPHNTVSEYYEAYRSSMNVMPVDLLSSAKLFRKHGIQYNPQGPFHKFSHKIVQSYLRHQIITIKINLAYFTLSAHVINDFGENPFARISPNEDGKYGSLYFYKMDSCCMAIKSFDYTEGDFHAILERALLEWSVLKICSVLECAPRLDHCLGFDLVIYEDCIQMAMEKCVGLKEMSLRWFEPLKQELEIMHSFNIIHADIKPDNIVFSPGLNKPVFIDFGFSSVIKEVPGQKKKSLFKGSPGFCSPQMLNLLSLNSLNEYIDLYYNDLHCLQICFKDSEDNDQTLESNNAQITNFRKFLFQLTVLRQPNRLYFHYRFKYYYISQDIHELRLLLKNKTIVKSEAEAIIKFMKDIFQHFFHLQIMEELKNYCFTHEYKLLMRQLSLQRSKIRLHVKQEIINEGDQQSIDFSSRFNHFLLKNEELEIISSINFKTYSQFLLSDDHQSLPKERCLDLLLHCLRFNIRNVPYKVKTKIAAKWRQILTKKTSQTCKESIENIQQIFKYLLNFCKEQPLNQWKRNNYFEILFHSIMLGLNSIDIFKGFVSTVDQIKTSLMDKLILETYLVELEDRLNSLNLAAEANSSALTFLVLLNREIRKLGMDINNAHASDYGQDAQIILRLKKEIKTTKTICEQEQHFKHILLILKQVKNKRLYIYYNGLIFQRKLRYHVEEHPTNQLLQMIRNMMKEKDILENMNIHVLFQASEMFMLKLQLGQQFKRMINEIKEIIGCSSIIEKFKMDKYMFLIDRQNRDIVLIIKYLMQLDRCYNQLQVLDTGVKRQLYYILVKLQPNLVDNTIKDLLISLYNKYRKTKDYFIWYAQYRIIDFQEILLKLDIEKQFITLLPELLPNLQQQIAVNKKNLHKMHKTMTITRNQSKQKVFSQDVKQVCNFVMLRYEYHQSKDYYYLLVGNRKQQLRQMLHLVSLSAQLKLHLINDHLCYRIILLSNRLKEENIFSQFVNRQYSHALATQSPIHYLLNSKHLLLIYTFKYFYKIDSKDKIISLMSMINHWINQNPLQSYLRSYIDCLEKFYRNFPTFFQYKTLKNYFPCGKDSKPYICVLLVFCSLAAQQQKQKIEVLRAICLMISRLTTYARQQILQRFYLVFASLKNISRRKVEMYLLRHNKTAFKSKPYSFFLTKRLKNKFSDCPKRAKLRECLSRLI